ncbi:MAG: endonuclease/exonuclease/phosphatase family protein [Muribaculaceae bacterium]|nr:endonuclease/exonuclease/phosphatase family protein [Muribaculaceae bacterium]
MRKFLAMAVLVCAAMPVMAQEPDEAPIKVMSINVRYDNGHDGVNDWANRADRVARAISFYDADIVGAQEVLANQLADLRSRLPQYASVGLGREDGVAQGEFEPVFYRRDRFEPVDTGHFWLSATPEITGSMGWDGACVRMASWVRLRDRKSGGEIVALNTHLDHVGVEARRRGAALLVQRLDSLSEGGRIPVIMTGDFNSSPSSEPIEVITSPERKGALKSARADAQIVYGPAWSYHDFGKIPYADRELIDYILVSPTVQVRSFGVLAETDGDAFISDHCPILSVISVRR